MWNRVDFVALKVGMRSLVRDTCKQKIEGRSFPQCDYCMSSLFIGDSKEASLNAALEPERLQLSSSEHPVWF